jgi:AhpD family alkylhydroperoxidase
LLVPVPRQVPWWLQPGLWIARKMTGKDPLPARLLTYFPKGAVGAALFELSAAGTSDLDGRVLAVARIISSLACGCPFCLDMNAATWKRAGLSESELRLLLDGSDALAVLGAREATAARFARALSQTPIRVDEALKAALCEHFSPRERVILATTISQVNYWSRLNQGLGVPSAGFFDQSVCPLPGSLPLDEGAR